MTADYEGQVLSDRYRVDRLLGKGGMGSVYVGEHLIIGRRVAIKILHSQFSHNEHIVARFYREARAAAAIGHKNIIEVLDVGVSDQGDPYLVMEYLEGESLRALLTRTGPLDVAAACGVLEPAVQALAAAHRAGIVHRDLKPDNIFIASDYEGEPRIKLIDFGISKVKDDILKTALTQTGDMLGTPAYMSPEQAAGKSDVDHRSDIFTMGVILYQLLTAELPFSADNYNALLREILSGEPTPPIESNPDFPVEAGPVIERAMKRDPAERYQGADELLEALQQLSGFAERRERLDSIASGIVGATVAAGDLGRDDPSDTGSGPAADEILADIVEQRTPRDGPASVTGPGRKRLTIASVVLGALLVVGAGVGLALWQGKDDTEVGEAAASPRIAVLPFEYRGVDDGQYLADGIAEEIASELAAVDGLRVITSSATARYKEKRPALEQIGEELGIGFAVEGSVNMAAGGDESGSLRIAARLVGSSDGSILWSETYERSLTSVARIHGEIADEVTAALGIRGSANRGRRGAATDNPRAYQAYLEGKYHASKQNREDMDRAIELFRRAVRLDPRFAEAHAALAMACDQMRYSYVPDPEFEKEAFTANERALELDPNLAEALVVRAGLTWNADNGFPHAHAIKLYRRAAELKPSLAEAHDGLALVYTHVGLLDEAMAAAEHTLVLDPMTRWSRFRRAQILENKHDHAGALEIYQRLPEDFSPAVRAYGIAISHIYLGQTERGGEVLTAALERKPDHSSLLSIRALLLALRNDREGALAAIARADETSRGFTHRHHTTYNLGVASFLLGDVDQALDWLEDAAQDGYPCYPMFAEDPLLAPLRGDPRFEKLLADLKRQGERLREIE